MSLEQAVSVVTVSCLVLFWADAFLIFFVYCGYPALLFVLARLKQQSPPVSIDASEPTVSLIIAAHNEEMHIASKLENSLALDYPRPKLQVIVVSDGSKDRTCDIVRRYTDRGVQLIELPTNGGKASAQNEAVKQANGEILVFTDADVFFDKDAVRNMVQNFQIEKVGCVIGKDSYVDGEENGVSEGEDIYWRYELFLRQKESDLGNLAVGSGSIMAIRRELFEPLDPGISEDFVLLMKAAIRGYKTVYEPKAVAIATYGLDSPRTLLNSLVRTITLDTRGILLCRGILNPFRYFPYACGLICHKVLRWSVPYLLFVIIFLNGLLLAYPFYRLTLLLQILFYGLAIIGYFGQRNGKPSRIVGIPFSFCLVNLAAFLGIARFVTGRQSGSWEPIR